MAYNNNPPTPNIFNKAHFYDRSREITVFFESFPLHQTIKYI